MILENITCLITTGNIESRKGFIIGPFCPIYGVGAILLIMLLGNNKKIFKTFLLGAIIGSSFEYFSSYVMQALYGIKFWDYSNSFMNLNGRTNLMYAFCWGVLSVLLIFVVEPIIKKLINSFKSKSLDLIILFFMMFNALATYKSLTMYIERINNKKDINQANELMSNKVMKIVFPNIIYVIDDNNQVLLSELLN